MASLRLRDRRQHQQEKRDLQQVVGRWICEMTKVFESVQTMPIPSSRPASEAPIIAKLLVAAKFECCPPVLIRRYSEAVTISQKISKKSR
jgi:hypothetical protein